MPDNSANLGLPFLLASQSQKHVTYNEAINMLDALLMLRVLSKTQDLAPTTPLEGQRYIIGANPIDEWGDKAGKIAQWQNLGWQYYSPQAGFIAFVEDEGIFYIYKNNQWLALHNSFPETTNFSKIGIGTSADNFNLLNLKANASLFAAKYINEGGNGDFKFVLNKENITKTGSLIFQNNWSGRAEIGLLGDDNFAIKTSIDGNQWQNYFSINAANGQINVNSLNLSNGNPILYPPNSDGANEFIKRGTSKFFHSPQAIGTNGNNIALGLNSLSGALNFSSNAIDASRNIAIGSSSLANLTSGNSNISIGWFALTALTTGAANIAIGSLALNLCTTGANNSAIGYAALNNLISGSNNSAFGNRALLNNTIGANNVAIGGDSLRYKIDGTNNIDTSNCVGIGTNARVSASNQVQLGGSGTTCYAYGAVQDRSDSRDKTDVRDTILGLDFINKLRPVDFRWDMRDDYFIADNDGTLSAIPKDGSKKRNRFHHGLIAQEVSAVIDDLGIDFGGYQNHALKGGNDVQSIGYTELIAPLIKAVQELSARIIALEN